MTKNELVKLEIEKRAFREVVDNFCRGECDPWMWCERRMFFESLLKKADKIQQIIDENYDTATDE